MSRIAASALVALLFVIPATAAEHEVLVDNFVFLPDTLTIQVGDTVTWTNVSGFHNVNAPGLFRCANGCDGEGGDGDPADNLWSFSRTFDAPADIDYVCDVHIGLGMIGNVTVVDGGAPTLTTGGTCPGSVTLDIAGGTPNQRAALLFGTGPGSDSLPGGPCAGLVSGLENVGLLAPVGLDASGEASLTVTAPMMACGVSIQALDIASCQLTNVDVVPGGARVPNKRRLALLKKRGKKR